MSTPHTAADIFNKKKGKKKFKSFNANKLDTKDLKTASAINDVADAAATDAATKALAAATLSSATLSSANSDSITTATSANDDWDEIKTTKTVVKSTTTVASMKSMAQIQMERDAQDNVAEKFRVQEIKDQLMQARGKVDENDVVKAAEDKEIADGWKKVPEKEVKPVSTQPAPAATNGKYVPSFRRNGGGGSGGTAMGANYEGKAYSGGAAGGTSMGVGRNLGSRFGKKVDTSDDSAFPTLAGGPGGGPKPTAAGSATGGVWGGKKEVKEVKPAAEGEEGESETIFEFAK
mgnify:CR=1 FL=1